MIVCPNCGEPKDSDERFCTGCGTQTVHVEPEDAPYVDEYGNVIRANSGLLKLMNRLKNIL